MITPTVENIYGPILIGCTLVGIFSGIVWAQMYHYFLMFKDDPRWLKLTMALLWVLDTIHIVFVVWNVYYFTVSHAVSLNFANIRSWTSGAVIISSNVNAGVVRAIFVHRIWALSDRSLPLATPLGIMCSAAAAFGIAYGFMMVFVTFAKSYDFSWLLYTTLSTEAFCDLFISTALFVLFRRLYIQAKSAHTLMHTLMIYSVNTGILQSVLALAVLVSYATAPSSGIYLGIFLVLPKASLNSLLAVLNARTQLRSMIPSAALLDMIVSDGPMSRGVNCPPLNDDITEVGYLGYKNISSPV